MSRAFRFAASWALYLAGLIVETTIVSPSDAQIGWRPLCYLMRWSADVDAHADLWRWEVR